MADIKYLAGYPPHLIEQVAGLLQAGKLGAWVASRYPDSHDIQTDRALYDYVTELKQRYMKNAGALAKVVYDNNLHPMRGTLGTNAFVSRVQGGKRLCCTNQQQDELPQSPDGLIPCGPFAACPVL